MYFTCLQASQRTATVLLGVVLVLGPSIAQAQPIYRIVGPDGKITFSDQPPPASSTAKVSRINAGEVETTAASAELPFELRTAVRQYPVTLYTTSNCQACDAGRNYLKERGIPFAEKTVTTELDGDAFRRLSGGVSLPYVRIGNKGITGYSDTEWGQYLTAASYPGSSVLPVTYKYPAPSALAENSRTTKNDTAADATRTRQAAELESFPAPQPGTPPSNPAGIKF